MHLPFAGELQSWFICDPSWTFPLIHGTRWQFHGSTTGSTSHLSVCAVLSIFARVKANLPSLILAYAPTSCSGTCLWSTEGGGFIRGPCKLEKGRLGGENFLGFGAAEAHGGGGGVGANESHGGGGGVGADEAHGGGSAPTSHTGGGLAQRGCGVDEAHGGGGVGANAAHGGGGGLALTRRTGGGGWR